MQHVPAPNGLPTPPASPLSFDHHRRLPSQKQLFQQTPQRMHQRYVPVAPEDRIGTFLGSSLQLTGIIGTGAYGVVYEAVDVKTNARYAVKALSKLNPDGSPLEQRQIEYQTREIRLHYMASAHPNVVSMLKIIDAYPDCLFVVLEYCPEGDLFYNITECGQFVGKDELARRVFLQILDAVHYLHQSGIYHRDLKPENILVTDQGETLKLADFGLATASERSEDYGCGSTFYMSPECLGQTNPKRPYYYCAANDVWSLGVILVNLTCGRNPWKQASHEDSTYRAYTRNAGFLKTILPLTDDLDDILARIFTANPDQRITLPELRHRILACPRFTVPPPQTVQTMVVPQQAPVAAPEHPDMLTAAPTAETSYDAAFDEILEDDEESISDDELSSMSPESSSECSLASSLTSTSSCYSSADALVEDDESDIFTCQDVPEIVTPPPVGAMQPPPAQSDMLAIYEPEDACMVGVDNPFHQQSHLQQPLPLYQFQNVHVPQEYVYTRTPVAMQEPPLVMLQQQQQPIHQQLGQHFQAQMRQTPPPVLQHQPPATLCAAQGKFSFPSVWDWMVGKNAQQMQQILPAHHHMPMLPFHHQVPMFLQGVY